MQITVAFALVAAVIAGVTNATPIEKKSAATETLSMTVCSEANFGGSCEDFNIDFSGDEASCVNFSGPLASGVGSATISNIQGFVAFYPLVNCDSSDGEIEFNFNLPGEEITIPDFSVFTSAQLVSFSFQSS